MPSAVLFRLPGISAVFRCWRLGSVVLLLLLLTGLPAVAQSVAQTFSPKKTKLAAGRKKKIGKILGADISFLPQLEAQGVTFYDKGQQQDAISILKDHGFNYIRLRIFNNPAADSGYSPNKGFCDLAHTQQMARRVKQAGLKLLLDFHYSDTWADPQKQFKPAAWQHLHGPPLAQALHDYTRDVLLALKAQGTLPDMVQIGNEINHGLLWPDGNIQGADSVARWDELARLLRAGIAAVREVAPTTAVLLHIALGGQHAQSVAWLDRMLARGVRFDVIGESYYPQWHGTIADLRYNLTDLARRYPQPIIVVEYSEHKHEVNDVAFSLPSNRGNGTFIWEPLNTWEQIFDKKGHSNALLLLYDELSRKYKIK